ncbi:hypothetical protein BJ508DRAFT_76952 [Ascobolus immersus RN42]|uniref:Uncharacterized protein n=1 Tax=Ascobolus immersus RN42 TaxID=1160509 RepID=A0A3N4HJW7_ASCIM|nr:hypothetical protein BJ508DRAFT_76952 [Ascobolus immersus RN42]
MILFDSSFRASVTPTPYYFPIRPPLGLLTKILHPRNPPKSSILFHSFVLSSPLTNTKSAVTFAPTTIFSYINPSLLFFFSVRSNLHFSQTSNRYPPTFSKPHILFYIPTTQPFTMKISILFLAGLAAQALAVAVSAAGKQIEVAIAPNNVDGRYGMGSIVAREEEKKVKAITEEKATTFIITEKHLFSHACAEHLSGQKLHPDGANSVCDIRSADSIPAGASADDHISLAGASSAETPDDRLAKPDFSSFTCTTTPSSPTCHAVTAAAYKLRDMGGRVVQRNEGWNCDTAIDRYGVRISLCSDKGDWLHTSTVGTIAAWFQEVCNVGGRCEGFVRLNRRGSTIRANRA